MSRKVSLVKLSDPTPTRLEWFINGFEKFELYIHPAPGDGHCLFHSVLNAFYIGYQEGIVEGVNKSRYDIARKYRNEIATWLEKTDINTGKMNYDLISNGNLELFGRYSSEFTLDAVKKMLRSSASLGQQFVSILEKAIRKRIFILDSNTYDVYKSGHVDEYLDSRCVVVYYSHDDKSNFGHFDTISCYNRTSNIYVQHFEPDHPFIEFLVERSNS